MKFSRKFKKYLLIFVSIFALILTCSSSVATAATVPDNYFDSNLNLKVKSAIAVDAKNGQVLYAKNANQKLPIASMSKMITIYLTLDAIKHKKLSWDQKIIPDKTAIKVSQNPDFASVNLKTGHSYTIRHLYQATLIESANGAAMTLGKAVAGSQKKFIDLMRLQLQKWGIKGAKIYTPNGLPNYTSGIDAYPGAKKNAENELSAGDVAIVAEHLLNDFPEVLQTTSQARMNFVDGATTTVMTNWNWMLKGLRAYDAAYPLDGLKTGTTDAAGACFTGTMVKNGRRIITVVMGARHRDGNDPARFDETKKLLHYVFSNYQLYILKKGHQFAGAKTIAVPYGKTTTANLVLQKDTGVWLRNDQKIKASFSKSSLSAPLTKGEKAGNFIIKGIPSLKNKNGLQLPATTPQNIAQVNIFIKFWRWLGSLL